MLKILFSSLLLFGVMANSQSVKKKKAVVKSAKKSLITKKSNKTLKAKSKSAVMVAKKSNQNYEVIQDSDTESTTVTITFKTNKKSSASPVTPSATPAKDHLNISTTSFQPQFTNQSLENKESTTSQKEEKAKLLISSEKTESKSSNYHQITDKLLGQKGWINNRNSAYMDGIEGFVKGVYFNQNQIFIMLEFDNKTTSSYHIEETSFISSTDQPKNIFAQEPFTVKTIFPLFSYQPEQLPNNTFTKMVYIFDKTVLIDQKNLQFVMTEKNGGRKIALDIKSKFLEKAEFIN